MFQTSLVIPICLFVIELYQACHNKTYHKAENIAEAGSQLPYILEKMALNPILRSFFLSAWQNLHFNLFTTIRWLKWSTRGGCEKRIALRISKETLSAGNQPKYFRVGIRPSDCKFLLENQWATNAVSFNCHFNGVQRIACVKECQHR